MPCIASPHDNDPANMVFCRPRRGGICDITFDEGLDVVASLLIEAFGLCEHLRWTGPTQVRNGGESLVYYSDEK